MASNSNNIFVGSIPYTVSEERVAEIFKAYGPVVNFRLIKNLETGGHMGYGFCEYSDASYAKLAIKELNGYELEGRPLRVNTAEGKGAGIGKDRKGHISGQQKDIDKALTQLSNAELYDILLEMKNYIEKDPAQARKLLEKKPVLAHALLKAQMKLDMLQSAPTPTDMQKTPQQQQVPIPPQQQNFQPPANPPNPPMNPGMMNPGMAPGYNQGGWNMPPQPQMGNFPYGQPPPGNMPPQQHHGMPPNMPPQHHMAPQNQMNMPPQQQIPPEVMRQLSTYTDEQIRELKPEVRDIVLRLRNEQRYR